MSDTKVGHIYKIVCGKSNDVYVGSTFGALRTRMSQHKRSFEKDEGLAIYKPFIEHGWQSLKMVLIASYEVVDRKHLLMYETLWVNRLQSINKAQPFGLHLTVNKRINKIMREKQIEDNKQRAKMVHDRVNEFNRVCQRLAPQMSAKQIEDFHIAYFRQYLQVRKSYRSPYELSAEFKSTMELEKHPLIKEFVKFRNLFSCHEIVEHDKAILESRE